MMGGELMTIVYEDLKPALEAAIESGDEERVCRLMVMLKLIATRIDEALAHG